MFITNMKAGEDIKLGDDIRIVVMKTERGHVKLGFDAPKDVKIEKGIADLPEKYSGETERAAGEVPENAEAVGNRIHGEREDRLRRYYGVRS